MQENVRSRVATSKVLQAKYGMLKRVLTISFSLVTSVKNLSPENSCEVCQSKEKKFQNIFIFNSILRH